MVILWGFSGCSIQLPFTNFGAGILIEVAQEEFLTINGRNERIYITPVRDDHGQLAGYFERFEPNFKMS